MNVTGVKRSTDWPFPMPDFTANAIDTYIDAISQDAPHLDLYLEETEGCIRGVSGSQYTQLIDYYVKGRWKDDIID